ncbi:hypothetical protein Tco_1533107 [Tanacetum coccineum]
MFGSKRSRDTSKYCHFYEDYRHDTNDCRHLKVQIQEAINSGQLLHLVKGIKKEKAKSTDTPEGKAIREKLLRQSDSPHNMLLGRTAIQKMGVVVSKIHGAIKFHTKKGVRTVLSIREADEETKRARRTLTISKERISSCDDTEEKVLVNDKYPKQMVTIGKQLPGHLKKELRNLLRANADIFAWTHADMTGIPRTIMVDGKPFNTEHKLNEYSYVKPIK